MYLEVIKLTQELSLATFAYIQCNNNQLDVFCTYLQYCFSKIGKSTFGIEELLSVYDKCFSLRLPNTLCESCLRILSHQGIINFSNRTITVIRNDVNPEQFDADISKLDEEELNLLRAFVEYAEKLGKTFTIEEASVALTSTLIKEDKALDIFIESTLEVEEDPLKVSDSWYMGKFICDILSRTDEDAKALAGYLTRIVEGIMIYIAVCNRHSNDSNINLNGTKVFLDTKIILRYLGATDDYTRKSAEQLVELIKECHGTVCVFSRTIEEVRAAIHNARIAISSQTLIEDKELAAFYKTHKNAYTLLDCIDNSLERNLQKNGFFIQNIDDDADISSFEKYLKDNRVSRSEIGAQNDAAVVSCIASIQSRNGYNKARFVTTNNKLVRKTQEYYKLQGLRCPAVQAEAQLLFTLWLPKSSQHSDLPELVLARNAYVAKQPNYDLRVKMKQAMQEYVALEGKEFIYTLEDLAYLEDPLMIQSKGDLSGFSGQSIKDWTDEKDQKIADMNTAISEMKKYAEEQAILVADTKEELTKSDILASDAIAAAVITKTHIRVHKAILTCIKQAPIIVSALVAIVGLIIGVAITNVGYCIACLFIIITGLLAVLCNKMPELIKRPLNNYIDRYRKKCTHLFEQYIATFNNSRLSDEVYNLAKTKFNSLLDKELLQFL